MLSHAAPGRAATPLARSDGHRGAPRVHRRPAGAPCDGAGVTRSPARRAGATAVAGALLAGAALVTTAAPAQALDSTRWGGADRYATAARVSQEAFPGGADEVVVVNGARFPDALSGAPLAATRGGPLLTVEAGSVPAATREELQRLRPQVVRVVGGTSSVSDDVVRHSLVGRIVDAYTTYDAERQAIRFERDNPEAGEGNRAERRGHKPMDRQRPTRDDKRWGR